MNTDECPECDGEGLFEDFADSTGEHRTRSVVCELCGAGAPEAEDHDEMLHRGYAFDECDDPGDNVPN